jgi:hypothetical protein
MRTRWVTTLAACTTLGVVLLAGCGDADRSDATAQPTPGSSSTPGPTSDPGEPGGTGGPTEPAGERCPYLTPEQVSTALGSPVTETAGSIHACFFDPPGGEGPSVMLSRVDVQIDPADYARQTRELCQGEVTDVDAGDEAFACVMGLGPQGQVYAGRVLVTVNVDDAADDATGIAVAASLLPEVRVPSATTG